jgi:DNA-binding transcriptional LysR family regulator
MHVYGAYMKMRELNLNSLVVFSGVYQTGSMTLASKDLGMTQPGVTQHIRNLENILNVELFHRMGKKLMPTKEAEILFEGLNQSLINIEGLLTGITNKERQFTGTVRIGVPIEFGNSYVLPNLSKIRNKYPQVNFHITYGLPLELSSFLLEGKIDFAFVDHYHMNPAIKTEVVHQENLILCCSKDYFEEIKQHKKERSFFENLSYVDYQPGEFILRDWFERAYGFHKMNLKIAAHCFDVQGIASLVRNSMGLGVLPEHVILKLKARGVQLHQFKSKNGTVTNPISLAYLEQRWNVPLNKFVMTSLKDLIMKK